MGLRGQRGQWIDLNKGEGEPSDLVVEGKGEVRGFWGLGLGNQPQPWWVEGTNRSAIDQGGN